MTTPPIRILAQQLLEQTQGRVRAFIAIAGPAWCGQVHDGGTTGPEPWRHSIPWGMCRRYPGWLSLR